MINLQTDYNTFHTEEAMEEDAFDYFGLDVANLLFREFTHLRHIHNFGDIFEWDMFDKYCFRVYGDIGNRGLRLSESNMVV